MKQFTEATRAVDYKTLKVSSDAFKESEIIPSRYTCDGKNINPPLSIEGIPEETKSLAIIVDDPDAPSGMWVHWLVWDIPVTHHIKEDHIPGKEGINDFKRHHYGGPCPPSGTHRYFFKVYALDFIPDLSENSDKVKLEKAISEHIIGFGELIGLYKRKK
jgi:Raf kinase inhibitor-like YbhB/YbcL family protein